MTRPDVVDVDATKIGLSSVLCPTDISKKKKKTTEAMRVILQVEKACRHGHDAAAGEEKSISDLDSPREEARTIFPNLDSGRWRRRREQYMGTTEREVEARCH